MNYLIKSTGRSGTHLLQGALASLGYTPYEVDVLKVFSKKYESFPPLKHGKIFPTDPDNLVIHDHSTWVPNNPEDYVVILLKRKDYAAQILSIMLSKLTGEWSPDQYTTKEVKPTFLDLEEVKEVWKWNLRVRQLQEKKIIEQTWKKSYSVYLEDIIDLGNYITCEFGEEPAHIEPDLLDSKFKNPRKPKEYLLNYSDAYDMLVELGENNNDVIYTKEDIKSALERNTKRESNEKR
jgi:hypothetical protein